MKVSRTSKKSLLVLLVFVPNLLFDEVSIAESITPNSAAVFPNVSSSKRSDRDPSNASSVSSSGNNLSPNSNRLYDSPSFSLNGQKRPIFKDSVSPLINPSQFTNPNGITGYDRDGGLPIPPPPQPPLPPDPPEPR